MYLLITNIWDTRLVMVILTHGGVRIKQVYYAISVSATLLMSQAMSVPSEQLFFATGNLNDDKRKKIVLTLN